SHNGNFVLTEFKLSAAAADQPAKPVKWKRASADFSQDGFPVAHAVDGRNDTGWAVFPEVGKAHAAVFEPAEPVGGDGETALTFVLDHQSNFAQHSVGKFRLAVTTAADPHGLLGLPAAVRDALALAPEKRTDAQRKELAAYYRTVA